MRRARRDAFDEVDCHLVGNRGIALGNLVRQLSDCFDGLDRLSLSEDTFLDEHMEDALTQHQSYPALWIRG